MKFIPWLVALMPVLRTLYREVSGSAPVARALIHSRILKMRRNQERRDAEIDARIR